MIYMILMYLICFAVMGLGFWAAWQSGKDVGYRNAMRDAEVLHDDTHETVMQHQGDE